MGKISWKIPEKVDDGTAFVISTATTVTEPRNLSEDPAFADFNLPLPDQGSPGTTGMALATKPAPRARPDVAGTPSQDRLKALAAENPPPAEWLEGKEEELF